MIPRYHKQATNTSNEKEDKWLEVVAGLYGLELLLGLVPGWSNCGCHLFWLTGGVALLDESLRGAVALANRTSCFPVSFLLLSIGEGWGAESIGLNNNVAHEYVNDEVSEIVKNINRVGPLNDLLVGCWVVVGNFKS